MAALQRRKLSHWLHPPHLQYMPLVRMLRLLEQQQQLYRWMQWPVPGCTD